MLKSMLALIWLWNVSETSKTLTMRHTTPQCSKISLFQVNQGWVKESESERKHLERRHQHGFFPADEGGLWRHLHTGGNTQRRNNVSTYNVLGWSEAAWKNCGMGVPWRVRRDRIHRRLWDRLWVRRGGRGPLQGGWKLPGGRGEWHNFDMKLWPIKNKSSQ